MKFEPIDWDKTEFDKQIKDVKEKFKDCPSMKEVYNKGPKKGQKGLQDIFAENPMLLAAFGKIVFSYNPCAKKWTDEMKLDDFRVDFAFASEDESEIALVEFEAAEENSIFCPKTSEKKKKTESYEWGKTYDHGCSQLIDWMYSVHDLRQTDKFRRTFSAPDPTFYYVLVVGWKKHVDDIKMWPKFDWRRRTQIVDSNKLLVYCYDELISCLEKAGNYMSV